MEQKYAKLPGNLTNTERSKIVTDTLKKSILSIHTMRPEDSTDEIAAGLTEVSYYLPSSVNAYRSLAVQHYLETAEMLANKKKNPSGFISAANKFLPDCAYDEKKEFGARLSLVIPVYCARLGFVEYCMRALTEATNNPEFAISKESVDEIYNLANMNRALCEAEFEEDPNRRIVWLDEAKHYASSWPEKLIIEMTKYIIDEPEAEVPDFSHLIQI